MVQIGFRFASLLGHNAVYPIDDDSYLDLNDSLKAIDQRRPEFKKTRDSIGAVLQKQADALNAWMRTTTIREHLLRLNGEDALRSGNSLGMFGGYLQAGEDQNYGGPQFLAQWYARNFNMAHNLTRLLRPDVRRVLVIVGAGHVPPRRNLLDEAPQFCCERSEHLSIACQLQRVSGLDKGDAEEPSVARHTTEHDEGAPVSRSLVALQSRLYLTPVRSEAHSSGPWRHDAAVISHSGRLPPMMELQTQLQRTLGQAYTIERELGGGGMSRVFVVLDNALGR